MKNELPGLSFDLCPYCGENAEVDTEKTDFKTIVLFCVNCKAEGRAPRYSLEQGQPVWDKPQNIEVYREAPAGRLQIRCGFDKKTGLCWIRFSGPKEDLFQAVSADETVQERVRSLLEPHLGEAY